MRSGDFFGIFFFLINNSFFFLNARVFILLFLHFLSTEYFPSSFFPLYDTDFCSLHITSLIVCNACSLILHFFLCFSHACLSLFRFFLFFFSFFPFVFFYFLPSCFFLFILSFFSFCSPFFFISLLSISVFH